MKFSIFKKIYSLVPKHLHNNLIIIFFANFIGNFLEIISISMLPIIVLNILNPIYLIDLIEKNNLNFFLTVIKNEYATMYLLSLVCFFYILKNCYLLSVLYFQRKLGIKIINYNRKLIFYNYLFSNYENIIKNNPSKIISLINTEIVSSSALVEICLLILRELILLIFIVVTLFFINIYSTLLIIFVLSVFLLIFYLSITKLAELGGRINLSNRLKNIKIVNETFDLIKEIKIYNKLYYFFELFNQQIKLGEKAKLFNAVFSAIPRLAVEICLILIILLIIAFNKFLFSNNLDLLPVITFIGASSIRIIPAFKLLASSINQISFSSSSLKMVYDEINKVGSNKDIYSNVEQVETLPFEKSINLQNINFNYSSNSSKKILSNINLKIYKGEKIGIIGSSGSGKSTLINIILGLLIPSNGHIYIDEKDIIGKIKNWQKNIGYVPQDVNLIQNTLVNNIAFALDKNDINIEKVEEVLKKAKLFEFANSNAEKSKFALETKGLNISGGQKQRVGISRAIYQNPKVLILDEATNSLDEQTEREILKNLFEEKHLTIIIVAHRISSLSNCDKIIYLMNGQIKDVGAYNDIVKKYKLI